MDEETLRLVLEVFNNASPGLKAATADAKALADQAERTQRLVKAMVTGAPMSTRQALSLSDATPEKQLAETRRVIVARKRELDAQSREDEKRIKAKENLQFQSAMRTAQMESNDSKRAIAESKARMAENTRVANAAIRDSERVSAAVNRQAQQQQNAIGRQRVQDMRQTRAAGLQSRSQVVSGIGDIFGGGRDIVSGAGRVAAGLGQLWGIMERGIGIAWNLATALKDGVLWALGKIEGAALIAGGTLAAFLAIIAKTGIEFNKFKQNTLITIDQLTHSSEKAKRIFDYSFALAIPSSFKFEEILNGARTLEAFGLHFDEMSGKAGRFIYDAVLLAQMMGKPLEQVVRFMGNLSQGRLLLQQAAPLGLGRSVLSQYGAEFDVRGSPKDRSKLIKAATAAIEDRGGDLINRMRETYESSLDSMVSSSRMFSGKVTEGMFRDFSKTFRNISEVMNKLLYPEGSTNPFKALFSEGEGLGALVKSEDAKRIVEALRTPFDLLGRAVEMASEHLPEFVHWLSEIVTKENIIHVLAQIITLFQHVGSTIKEVFDIASGGKGIVGLWDNFKDAAGKAFEFVIKAWGYIQGVFGYFAGVGGKKIWGAFKDGLEEAKKILEIIVGIMVINAGASILGGIGQIIIGIGAMVAGFAALSEVAGTVLTILSGIALLYTGIHWKMSQMKGGGNPSTSSMASAAMFPIGIPGMAPSPTWSNPPGVPGSGFAGPPANMAGPGPVNNNLPWWLQIPQSIGHAAIGAVLGTAKQQIPQSVTDFMAEANAAGEAGSDKMMKWYRKKFPEQTQANEADVYAALSQQQKESVTEASKKKANLEDAEVSVSYIDATISAYKEASKAQSGGNKDVERRLNEGLIPMLRAKAQAEGVATTDALEEFYAAKEKARNFEEPFNVYGEEAQKYWKAVGDEYKTQAEIGKIQKESLDAGKKQMEDANKAQTEMVQAQIEMLPESEQAAARVKGMIPLLIEKQKIIADRLKEAYVGSEEYYNLQTESYKTELQMADLRNKSADEAAKQAFDLPKRQFTALHKLIGMLPKTAQGAESRAILLPKLNELYAGAMQERDPVKRQDKLLEILDLFSELKESFKTNDPFKGAFDAFASSVRSETVQRNREAIFGDRSGRQGTGRRPLGGGPVSRVGHGRNRDLGRMLGFMGGFLNPRVQGDRIGLGDLNDFIVPEALGYGGVSSPTAPSKAAYKNAKDIYIGGDLNPSVHDTSMGAPSNGSWFSRQTPEPRNAAGRTKKEQRDWEAAEGDRIGDANAYAERKKREANGGRSINISISAGASLQEIINIVTGVLGRELQNEYGR